MAEEGSSARVVRNTLANGIGTLAAVVASLVLTPFLINGLGVETFGVWALALSLSVLGGYASLADLGIETSAARYVAEARSNADEKALRETASTAMAFFGVVALVVAVPLAALSFPLVELFNVPDDLHDPAVACFALIAAQLLVELPARVFFAVLEGAQRYDIYQLIEVLRAVSQAAMFAVVLIADLGLAGLGAAMPLSSVVVLLAGWLAMRRVVPGARISPRHVSRARFRTLFAFGSQYFLVRFMGTLYRQMDKAIVGIALGLRFVTLYEVANRIHQAASLVQSIAASALLPTTAFLRNQTEVLRDLYLRGTSYAVAISLPVVVAGFVFAEPLIRTWIGESVTEASGSARLFLSFVAFTAVHAVGSAMIVGLGQMRFVIWVTVVFILVNLGVSVALVEPLGVDGVILGTVIAQAVIWVPYTRKFLRTFGVRVGEWLRRVIVPNLPGLAAQGVTAFPLLWLANRAGTLPEVAGLALASVILSLVAFVLVGLSSVDRQQLMYAFRGALGLRDRSAEVAEPS